MIQLDDRGSNLIFLISLPRSGSTLLQRILGGQPDVATLAEPWLMLHPLYALKREGIQAEYDASLARDALDDFLAQIDGGEDAYFEGIRRFAGDLYARAAAKQGKTRFLDKTPRYYRIIPELQRVFPHAKFVFLLRNPLAALSSTLHTWFDGDPVKLNGTSNHRDLLDGPGLLLAGIEALGDDAIVVRYEDLIEQPDASVAALCGRLGLNFDSAMLEYGRLAPPPGRFGDQVGIHQYQRASTAQRDKWITQLAEPARCAFARQYLNELGDTVITAFGYDAAELREQLDAALAGATAAATPRAQAERRNAEGEARFAEGDFGAAQACFERACALDPEFSTAANNLVVLFWETGRTEQALAHLADALERAPDDRDLVINGAQILRALAQHDAAQDLCRRYLERHPAAPDVAALLDGSQAPIPVSTETSQVAAEVPAQADFPGSAAITVATSIAPKGIDKQQRAIASWRKLGFRVVSLNTPQEIAELKAHFDGVEFVPVARHGKQLAGKPYVFLDDVLAYLHDASGSRVCGIVNSDIILRGGPELPALLWREAQHSLVYGSRVDIRAADDSDGAVYHRGFDIFFLDRAVIPRLPRTDFMLGVPWWDYWVPIGYQQAGVTIKRLDSRVAFHVWHPTNYSAEILLKFGREFTGHCAGADFVGLYTQSQDARFGNVAFSVLADAALDHINRNTAKITLSVAPTTEPARADRPRVSAIVSTYQSAAFIGECLHDLTSQTIADRMEIIVIDAASPEDERGIVADYQRRFPHIPIRYQRTPQRIGVYAAWNLAAQMAQGDYLISCSTNDRLRSDACEILARTLDEQPDVALVYGNSFMTKRPHQRFENAELCSLYLWTDYRYEDLVDRSMVGPHPMWRRSVHAQTGYFDESYTALGDQEFWLRLGEREKLLNIPDFTGLYYVSESSLTGNSDVALRETDRVRASYQWRYRYPRWRRLVEARRATHATDTAVPAVHVVLLVAPDGLGRIADTVDALGAQRYANWRMTVLADRPPPDPTLVAEAGLAWECYSVAAQLPQVIARSVDAVQSDWVVLLDAGDRPAADFLADAMAYAQAHNGWQLIYFDDDRLDAQGERTQPRFKPDFNLALLRCQPYVGSCVLVRTQAFRTSTETVALQHWRGSDLALRIADRFGADAVGHIPRVMLTYAPDHAEQWSKCESNTAYRNSVLAHLQRRGIAAEVTAGQSEGLLQMRRNDVQRPSVSVIVHGGNADEQRLAVQAVLNKTGYPNYDLIILQPPAARGTRFEGGGAQRIRTQAVGEQMSAADLNAAAQSATGEMLLWLDGRSVVLQEDWIERLLGHLTDDVGIVAGRVIDRRKALLDGGVILGLGTRAVGARVNVGLHVASPGYLQRAQCEQDLSAVTSLCALTRRDLFNTLGGFGDDLSIGLYRDIDWSLRMRAAGWRIVWTPAASVMSLCTNADADRPPRDVKQLDTENRRMLDRWFVRLTGDPAFNRNLSHLRPDFQPELNTVVPWDPVADGMPRVLGFGAGSLGSWQYRVKQPLTALHDQGRAQCSLTPFSDKKSVALPTPVDIENMQPHALLLHNTLHDDYLDAIEQYRRYNRVSLVFGQDDLMFALPPNNPFSKTVYKDIKKRMRRCMEMCDRVIVTTQPLAEALRGFSQNIDIVPNFLSRAVWDGLQSQRGTGARPRVGWAGAQQHGGDLQLLFEVVKATADAVDWVFFGMCPEPLRPYVREFHKAVPFADYPRRLAGLNLDLAVAPLERNLFNEAKSNLRLLEYGALGWPVIASDIEPYRNAPVCRVANNAAAWIRAIREHIADPQALAAAGDALRDWVHAGWMLEDRLDNWLTALLAGHRYSLPERPKNAVSL